MEKSSEKLIREASPVHNPFNNLLSEVHLRLPKPSPSRPDHNLALLADPIPDRSSCPSDSDSQYVPDSTPRFPHRAAPDFPLPIRTPLRTKNSSDSLPAKTQQELITEWICGFMQRRQLLGPHWEHRLAAKNQELMEYAFEKVRESGLPTEVEEKQGSSEMLERKLQKLVQVGERRAKRAGFEAMREFYRDELLLFRLSNTMGEEKEQSFMLRLDSDCGVESIRSHKFRKDLKKNNDLSLNSKSNEGLHKRSSEASCSEDLSALILNHNKLQLSGDLNRSVPNIPRAKASAKAIDSNRDIGDLSLSTKKQIQTNRKLADDSSRIDDPSRNSKIIDDRNDELPLNSNRNLVKPKGPNSPLSPPSTDSVLDKLQKEEESPFTLTFLLKNMNMTKALQQQRQEEQRQRSLQMQKLAASQNTPSPNHNLINRIPISHSFYQPRQPLPIQNTHHTHNNPHMQQPQIQPPRNVFVPPQNDPQFPDRRSISLQMRPVGLFPPPPEILSPSQKAIYSNEYYPEEAGNKAPLMRETVLSPDRVRARSATPRITFTFTSNVQQTPKPQPAEKPSSNPRLHPYNGQHDFIIEKSLLAPAQPIPQVSPGSREEPRHNKFQIVTPSQTARLSPKRSSRRPIEKEREHIKNLILPPVYCDYYGLQKQSQRKPFKESEASDKMFLLSTAQTSQQTARQAPKQADKYLTRMKSPKEKILVTSASSPRLDRD